MKQLITIVALLFTINSFSQNYNTEKDKWVSTQMSNPPVSTNKIISKDGITTFYELKYPEMKVQVEVSPGVTPQRKRSIIIVMFNTNGQEVATNDSLANKDNRVSRETIQKIRQQVRLIK